MMPATMLTLLFVAALACICGAVSQEEGKHWALLVAGSNSWYNYRHQADICHAYQVLHMHGIPDERIVVMMYDDLANNTMNPTPGIIINHPDGPDVYKGVPKDYIGEETHSSPVRVGYGSPVMNSNDVTPDVFLNVLTGNKEALNGIGSGKVIESGPNDHVFVNFADHGAPGILAFPSDELHAMDLNNAIQGMYDNKQFKQMVLYVEACESGSMFKNLLPDNINVFATTASNPDESSYACYFDDLRSTYLGDVYSVNWMEDSDAEDLTRETLKQQFKIVRKETNTSHVKEYGDTSISKEHVGDFQGKAEGVRPILLPTAELTPMRSEDVPMAILQHRLSVAQSASAAAGIRRQIEQLNQTKFDIQKSMRSIAALVTNSLLGANRVLGTRHDLYNHACYKPAVEKYDEVCWDISQNDYALRQLYVLVNLCEEGYLQQDIQMAIEKVCKLHLY